MAAEWRTLQIISFKVLVLPSCCIRQRVGQRDYPNIYLLSLLKTLWLSMLQSPVLASLLSFSCPFLAAVAAGIQYINMHFAKLTEGWPQCQSCAGRVSSTKHCDSKSIWYIMKNTSLSLQTTMCLSHKFHIPFNQLPSLWQQAGYSNRSIVLQKFVCSFCKELPMLLWLGHQKEKAEEMFEIERQSWKTFSTHHQCCISGEHCFGFRCLRNCLFKWKKKHFLISVII